MHFKNFHRQEPKIIKSNISVLLNEGLKKHGSDNFLVAKETCKALQNLLPPKEQGKMIDHTLRYPKDHEIFKILHKLLIFGIWKTKDSYYIPMANEAINLVFGICDQPDEFCKNLIVEMHENILSRKRPVKNKNCIQGNILNNKNTDGELMVSFKIKFCCYFCCSRCTINSVRN